MEQTRNTSHTAGTATSLLEPLNIFHWYSLTLKKNRKEHLPLYSTIHNTLYESLGQLKRTSLFYLPNIDCKRVSNSAAWDQLNQQRSNNNNNSKKQQNSNSNNTSNSNSNKKEQQQQQQQ
ncbi:hypothetical protein ElyMa_003974400 [Elysia marginata]|uniref:Uncharacterized protein n=1 Tax=Elysia marginata TaxID=1093978 RepID=A0AAV4FWP7_9GAST|nr:hypothetical protein ElyMa_003974400 [Elysia marginata]